MFCFPAAFRWKPNFSAGSNVTKTMQPSVVDGNPAVTGRGRERQKSLLLRAWILSDLFLWRCDCLPVHPHEAIDPALLERYAAA
jgi:hypothetical protein